MAGLSVADVLTVRSQFRDYQIAFVKDAVATLKERILVERTFTICDARVAEIWGDYLRPMLAPGRHVLLPPREESKTITKAQELIVAMVEAGVRRDHSVLAIGGGITQDVSAFAASILYRGIEWLFIPTTLLAQADSCLGSKTSINIGDKKNLAGGYWPPSVAALDARFLRSLPKDDLRSGLGEIIHFLVYDASPLLERLPGDYGRLIGDPEALRPYIAEALSIKRRVAELDEFDRHERKKFNYGHTFGHALESVTKYAIPHGLAVTVGMDIANFLSMKLGIMSVAEFERLNAVLRLNIPARSGLVIDVERYLHFLGKDKKNVGSTLGCVLAERPGALSLHQLPMDAHLRDILRAYFDGMWRD